jgi:predicted TIM-barrel fold metal-dependent hydrolase
MERTGRALRWSLEKIIDAHIHCSNSKNDLLIPYARLNGLRYNFDELLTLMEKNGIEKGLLISSILKRNGLFPNQKILDFCNRSHDRLYPVITVDPSRSSIAESISLAKENRSLVKAFKIPLGYLEVFAYDDVYDPLYDCAESEGLPVLFHTGDTATSTGSLIHSHPLTLDKLADKREQMKIVACHFGNPWIQDAAELAYKHPNLYTDISGLFLMGSKYAGKNLRSLSRKITDAIYYIGGADKILFGTDYPVGSFESTIFFTKSLAIDEEDRRKIMYFNSAKLFGIQ